MKASDWFGLAAIGQSFYRPAADREVRFFSFLFLSTLFTDYSQDGRTILPSMTKMLLNTITNYTFNVGFSFNTHRLSVYIFVENFCIATQETHKEIQKSIKRCQLSRQNNHTIRYTVSCISEEKSHVAQSASSQPFLWALYTFSEAKLKTVRSLKVQKINCHAFLQTGDLRVQDFSSA